MLTEPFYTMPQQFKEIPIVSKNDKLIIIEFLKDYVKNDFTVAHIQTYQHVIQNQKLRCICHYSTT